MTASKSFVQYDTVAIKFTIYVDDVLTNPGAFVFTHENPDGDDNTVAETSTGTGRYRVTVRPAVVGWQRWRATGTAPAPFAREGSFYVYDKGIVPQGST